MKARFSSPVKQVIQAAYFAGLIFKEHNPALPYSLGHGSIHLQPQHIVMYEDPTLLKTTVYGSTRDVMALIAALAASGTYILECAS